MFAGLVCLFNLIKTEIMNQPLVSIIVPCFNVEQYLPVCLDSLIKQTYQTLEIIIINDGSTDRTLEVAQQYQKRDARVILIDQKNRGVSESRNTALKCAKGDYVLFVDADDWLDIQTVQICIGQTEAEHADVCFFAYQSEFPDRSDIRRLYPENRIFIGKECRDLQRRIIGPINEELYMPQRLDSYGTIWAKLYRKDLLKDLFFEDLNKVGSAEDTLFNSFVFLRVKKAVYINQPFYHYRRNNDASVTKRFRPHLLQQWSYLFSEMSKSVQTAEAEEALLNRVAISLFGYDLNVYAADITLKQKIQLISECLSHPLYIKAYQQLKYSHLPIHWRLFYLSAKYKFSVIVLFFAYAIQMMRR